jgi:hypothetical protein
MVLSAAGLIFALMSGVGYYLAREMLLKNAEENARNQAQALVQKIESKLAPIPRVPRSLAYELADGRLDEAGYFAPPAPGPGRQR